MYGGGKGNHGCNTGSAGLAHVIRQQGLGDRVAWGKWCYEELEKEREQGGEKASWKERIRGALIFSYDRGRATNLWRIGSAMNQFP